MNERIKELVEQAGFSIEGNEIYYDISHYEVAIVSNEIMSLIKLVAEDCAKVADDNFNKGFCPVGDYIKQNFGVTDV
jgi:hypothetical protein